MSLIKEKGGWNKFSQSNLENELVQKLKFKEPLIKIRDAMKQAGLERLGLYGSDDYWRFDGHGDISEEYAAELYELDGLDESVTLYKFVILTSEWDDERRCILDAITLEGNNMLFSWKWWEYKYEADSENVLAEYPDEELSEIWAVATQYKSEADVRDNLDEVFKAILENLDLLIKLAQAENKLRDAGQWEE